MSKTIVQEGNQFFEYLPDGTKVEVGDASGSAIAKEVEQPQVPEDTLSGTNTDHSEGNSDGGNE